VLFFIFQAPFRSYEYDMLLNNQSRQIESRCVQSSEQSQNGYYSPAAFSFFFLDSMSVCLPANLPPPPNIERADIRAKYPTSIPSRAKDGRKGKQNIRLPSSAIPQPSPRDSATHPHGQPDGHLGPSPLPRLAKIGAGRLLRPPCLDNPQPLIPLCPPTADYLPHAIA
jgi:hypothetical protein